MTHASDKELAELHGVLAKTLTEAITTGVTVVDDEGKAHKAPAPAAILNVARQFLKDNNIQATSANTDVKLLVEALPTFDEDVEETTVYTA